MGRQFKSPRLQGPGGGISGHFREFVGPVPGSSSDVTDGVTAIPSYGVTDISTWAASTYMLAPPVAGCMKTFVSHNSSGGAAARVIALSSIPTGSTAPGSVTVGYNTPTSGASGNTHLAFGASTADICVTLMGVNSTHWVIVSAPTTTSTGFVGFKST